MLWDNCQIYKEAREPSFMLMDYVVHGALLSPVMIGYVISWQIHIFFSFFLFPF